MNQHDCESEANLQKDIANINDNRQVENHQGPKKETLSSSVEIIFVYK